MATFVSQKWRLFADWMCLAELPQDRTTKFLIWDSFTPFLPLQMVSHICVCMGGKTDIQRTANEANEFPRQPSRKDLKNLALTSKVWTLSKGLKYTICAIREQAPQRPKGNGQRTPYNQQWAKEAICTGKSAMTTDKIGQSHQNHWPWHPQWNTTSAYQCYGTTTAGPCQAPQNGPKVWILAPLHDMTGIQVEGDDEYFDDRQSCNTPATLNSLIITGKIRAPKGRGHMNKQDKNCTRHRWTDASCLTPIWRRFVQSQFADQ